MNGKRGAPPIVPRNPGTVTFADILVHYMLTTATALIIVFGVMGEKDAISVLFRILSPFSHWAAEAIPLVKSMARKHSDPQFAMRYMSVLYVMCLLLYGHMTAAFLIRNWKSPCFSVVESATACSAFFYRTIYSHFSVLANPVVPIMRAVGKRSFVEAGSGTIVRGFSYYASMSNVWITYALMVVLIFFLIPQSDRVVSGYFFLKFGFPIAFYLLAIAQIATLLEILLLLISTFLPPQLSRE